MAGKTGTAELDPTADAAQDPKNTTAWFVAFAPACSPTVAVAVMLPGAGQGGASAAPIAKRCCRPRSERLRNRPSLVSSRTALR